MTVLAPVQRTSRHEDDPLLKAIQVGLGNAHDAGEHHKDHLTAGHIAAVLDAHGMVLPAGIAIGLVYRVVRQAGPDGYQFTDRREADDHARFGGTDGRCGTVEQGWRIQGDGVDVTTMWRPVND